MSGCLAAAYDALFLLVLFVLIFLIGIGIGLFARGG
jgi:hypothetical protein